MGLEILESMDRVDWQEAALDVLSTIETRMFVAGAFVDSATGKRFESVNPATGETIASIACANEKDVDKAVGVARRAFRDGRWSRLAPRKRTEILYRWAADLVTQYGRELAVLETIDMGKPINDVVTVDLPAVVAFVRFCGECIDKIDGRVSNTEADAMHIVMREPYGVVAAISPWNYPLLMATWKVAPALAAGNAVVLKPAEQAPLSCLRLAELFVEAGGPDGVFNVLNGPGDITGLALALHRACSESQRAGI